MWEKIGLKELNAAHMYRYFPEEAAKVLSSLWLKLTEQKFKLLLPEFCTLFERESKISKAELTEFFGTNYVEIHTDDLLGPNATNSEKMHFKIEHAWQLAQRANEEFDLFLRIRPDKYLEPHGTGFDWSRAMDL